MAELPAHTTDSVWGNVEAHRFSEVLKTTEEKRGMFSHGSDYHDMWELGASLIDSTVSLWAYGPPEGEAADHSRYFASASPIPTARKELCEQFRSRTIPVYDTSVAATKQEFQDAGAALEKRLAEKVDSVVGQALSTELKETLVNQIVDELAPRFALLRGEITQDVIADVCARVKCAEA